MTTTRCTIPLPPTGDSDRSTSEGIRAERSLQPGNGTTDVIAGVYHTTLMLVGDRPVNRFLQARIQVPVNARAGYGPGNQYSVIAGAAWLAGLRYSGMLQLNALIRDRDRGPEAEPEEGGGSFLWLARACAIVSIRVLACTGSCNCRSISASTARN